MGREPALQRSFPEHGEGLHGLTDTLQVELTKINEVEELAD